MKKPISYNIRIDLYRYDFVLIFAPTPESCDKELEMVYEDNSAHYPYLSPSGNLNFWGRFTLAKNAHPDSPLIPFVQIVINEESKKSLHRTISHEAIHLAFEILSDRGIEVCYDNQEPLTYLVDHICEKIEEHIPNKNP